MRTVADIMEAVYKARIDAVIEPSDPIKSDDEVLGKLESDIARRVYFIWYREQGTMDTALEKLMKRTSFSSREELVQVMGEHSGVVSSAITAGELLLSYMKREVSNINPLFRYAIRKGWVVVRIASPCEGSIMGIDAWMKMALMSGRQIGEQCAKCSAIGQMSPN